MIYYYLLNFIFSLLVSLAYLVIWRKRFNVCFTFIQVMMPVVCLAALLRALSTTLEEAILYNALIYLSGCYFLPLLFFGIVSLCDVKINRWVEIGSFVLETIIYGTIVTNKYTNLFYTSFALGEDKGTTTLIKTYGPVHTIAYIFIFIFMVASIGVLFYSLRYKRKAAKKHIIVLTVITALCTILFFASRYIIGPAQEDVLSYAIAQLALLVICRESSYYYVDSYMLENLSQGNGLGCITFDSSRRLLVCNEKAEEWFPELRQLKVGEKVINAEGINPRFSEWLDRFTFSSESFSEIVRSGEKSIKFDVSYRDVDKKMCYCFLLSDDTAQQELLRVLNNDIAKVTGAVSKYVDPSLMENIIDDSGSTNGEEFPMAIMFADIRGFTSIMEQVEAHQMINILNKYLSIAEKAIHKYGGTLDKFIGDGVMAFWIDVKNDGTAALNAAKAALEIKNNMISIEDEIYEEISNELFYGIGLNYGRAVLGSVGSENRKDYTIIGDAVNMASRLENATPKNVIYVTEAFKDVAGDAIEVKKSENAIRVKGKAAPIIAYELIGVTSDQISKSKESSLVGLLKQNKKPTLYICGCRGSYPVSGIRYSQFGGETTCYILKIDQHAIVIDCGTGFYNAEPILRDCKKIDVLLTHLHYDHCLGLLKWSVFPKKVTPTFYGNFKQWDGQESISQLFRPPFWPVDLSKGQLIDVPENNDPIDLGDNVSVRFFDSPHPNHTKLMLLNIGNKRLCVMGDCETYDGIPLSYLRDCDYVIYDGMYDDADYTKHIGWGHSTWQEAVRFAQKANVGQLIISHHDVESSDAILIDRENMAKLQFPATAFAKVGDRYEL